ncbi:hypothetical protein MMC11_008473 [Xylographa trunciseda]|nr:hypothetical protein [Xylographa trunciseda]
MLIDGEEPSIGYNLDLALRHFRLRPEVFPSEVDILIWVDAVCIDQSNVSERNQQVAQMRSIYAEAKEVIVWLGEPDEHSEKALPFLRDLERRVKPAGGYEAFLAEYSRTIKKYPVLEQSPDYEGWLALNEFLARPWFERAWIIQEVTVAIETVIHELAWSKHVTRLGKLRALVYLEFRELAGQPSTPLEQLLVYGRTSKSSDPRDKEFALLGLAAEMNDPSLKQKYSPDYNKPVPQVYREVVELCVIHSRRLDILSYCCDCAHPGLPTWAPGWSCNANPLDIFWPDSTQQNEKPGNSGSDAFPRASGFSDTVATFSEDFKLLMIRGAVVGKVAFVVSYDQDTRTTLSAWASLLPRCSLWQQKSYPNGESIDEAYWRTLVMNRADFNTALAPAHYGIAYLIYTEQISPADGFKMAFGQTGSEREAWQHVETVINFGSWVATVINRRSFFICDTGYFGLAPESTREGDVVAVMLGAKDPFVLRQEEADFKLIGKW